MKSFFGMNQLLQIFNSFESFLNGLTVFGYQRVKSAQLSFHKRVSQW